MHKLSVYDNEFNVTYKLKQTEDKTEYKSLLQIQKSIIHRVLEI